MTIVVVMTAFNTLLAIGIAGSVAKLIKSLNDEERQVDRSKWAQIIRERRVSHMQEGNQATYADMDEEPRNWDGVPREKRNWDGIPRPRE